MNRISTITRGFARVINVQAAEGSHRDNAQCDPELFKAYLTQKMNKAVKDLSSKERNIGAFIAELIEDDLDKIRKKRKRPSTHGNDSMGSVKSACLAELSELIEFGYSPDKDIEGNTKKAESEMSGAPADSSDPDKRNFNSASLKQRLFKHNSAYCELNSILKELNVKLSSALRY